MLFASFYRHLLYLKPRSELLFIEFNSTVALEHNNLVFFRLFVGLLVCVIEAMNTKDTA